MSSKKYLGAILAFVPILLILITLSIVFNNRDTLAGEEDWTNIAELSDEFLSNYFESYREVRKDADPENFLMVTSKTRPNAYGAINVIEAPNYLYILQYDGVAAREQAFENLVADGVIVERNQIYNLTDKAVDKKLTGEERLRRSMGDIEGEDDEDDDEYLSWGIYAMSLDDLLDDMSEVTGLPTVTVAVIDSGMDVDDFNDYFPDRTLLSYCVVECESGIDDRAETKHGTHVGGTVAEATSNNVQIMAIKTTNDPKGSVSSLDTITAINYAVEQGVDVINMSLGGPDYEEAMNTALQAAEDAGIISVASAGNDNVDTLYYPASYDSVFSIAALQQCENDEECILEKWDDSNYGEKIDFAAPGAAIAGINGYYMSGTSMASPHVAAAVANLKSLNKSLTRSNAKELLKKYLIDFGDEDWDQYYGWGMPNFYWVPGFCSDYDCDDYGVFASDWLFDADTLLNDVAAGKVNFALRNTSLTLTSSKTPLAAIIENDGFTRLMPIDTEDENTKTFDLTGLEGLIHMVFVGDVNLNGSVNSADSLLIDYSRLSKTNPNYTSLSDYQKAIGDINRSGSVNSADSLLIDYSRLSKTNINYRPLEW